MDFANDFCLKLLWSCYSFTGRHNVSSGSPLAGKLFVVIGAGGAGKALAYGAKAKGARVVIANRTYGEIFSFCMLHALGFFNTLLFVISWTSRFHAFEIVFYSKHNVFMLLCKLLIFACDGLTGDGCFKHFFYIQDEIILLMVI